MGIDSSEKAIKMAQKNAKYHKVSDRCQFFVGNMLEPLKNVGTAFMAARNKRTVPTFDLIVSNPPYIPTPEIENLPPEIKNWEPRQALDGGEDGLFYLRKIIKESPKFLKKGGYLILEFGAGQAPALKKLADSTFQRIEILKDLSKKERIFLGQT
jgi:release factor glutamine methyltransferase